MGKGKYEGRNPTLLEMEQFYKFQNIKERAKKLEDLGYEVVCDYGVWKYRQSGTNRNWTLMDKK